MKEETSIAPDQFFERYGPSLGLAANPHLKLEQVKSETGAKGAVHRRYQLYYDSIEVEGMEFFLHAQEGKVRSASGKVVSELEINVEKRLSEAEALESARKQLNADEKSEDKESQRGELIIARADIDDYSPQSFKLAYKFLIAASKPFGIFEVYVDAKTGKIIKQVTAAYNCFSPHATQTSVGVQTQSKTKRYFGGEAPLAFSTFVPIKNRYLQGQSTIPFETEFDTSPSQYRLGWLGNGYGTYRLETKEYSGAGFISGSKSAQDQFYANMPIVLNPSTSWQTNHQEATTTHWTMQKTYNYYSNVHQRSGPANNNEIGRVITNVPEFAFGTNPQDFYGPSYFRTFGNQAGKELIMIQSPQNQSWTALDVVGHEFTHGVTKYTSNLVYEKESGALNESFSDIMGYCIDRRTFPNDWNWDLGEDIGFTLRNMQNPNLFNQPSAFQGANWWPQNGCTPIPENDHCGVHRNSGVMNHWFFLLLSGGNENGVIVSPIAFDRAEKIIYDAFAHRMGVTSNYADARSATLAAAQSLYGTCSNEYRQVGEAWHAVNVGAGSGCAADCNYTVTATANPSSASCGAPVSLTANCVGSGCPGIDYSWYGPGINGTVNGQTVNITMPPSPGTYSYGLNITKVGCNFSNTSVSINTNCGLPLSNGCYTIKAKHSNKLMQPENGNNGARIRQYSANGQNNQIFQLEAVDGDAYKIKPFGTSKVWEASGGGTGYGTAIQQNDYNGGNYQKWLVSAWGDGTYRLAPKHQSSVVADVEGTSTSDGAGLHLWGQHAGDNQRFYMNAVSCPSTQPNCNFSATTNPSTINTSPSASITLNASCSGSDCGGVSYQWSGNGANSSSSSYTLNAPGSNGSYNYTVTLSKPGCNSSTASVTVNVGSTPPPTNCINLSDLCSGNSSEIRSYNFPMSSGGSKSLGLEYRAHEGNATGRIRINGGSWQTFPLSQTPSNLSYLTTGIGSYSFNSGNNTVELASGGGFICFRNLCTDGGGGGCQTPNPPTVSSSSSTPPSNLSASGCNGTVNWSHGASGANVTVNPASTTTYTATCTVNSCTSSASNGVTVTVGGGGSLNQCLESENSGGNGTITSDPFASNGQTRGEENNYNHYVDYQVTGVPVAGTYTLALQYYASVAPSISIQVGSNTPLAVNLPTSGSWNIANTTQSVTVQLGAGSNTIRIQGTGGGSCRQDKICVTGNGSARLGVAEEPASDSPELTVSPNPNSGEFEASFYVEPGRKATLRVSDVQGREVWKKNLVGAGAHREQVRLPAQSVGSYILLLDKQATDSKAKVEFKRVIVVK